MNEDGARALLPPGFNDILPPDAAFEADIVGKLMARVRASGYEQVKPPLVEYEDTLLAGDGASMTARTFRLMDPMSHRMLAVRPDMTLQIARIATTRLMHEPRPLRLCYAGQVLQVAGSQLRPERQVGQMGCELIGTDSPVADAEIVALAAESLAAIGVADVSVDLNLPPLVPAVASAAGLDAAALGKVRAALDRKDAAAVKSLGGRAAGVLGAMLAAAGPADPALTALRKLDLPEAAREAVRGLEDVVARVREAAPSVALTIDPVENRGFEYHTGISFSIFSRRSRDELGRGGRYRAGGNGKGEPSTGFTLFMDTVLRACAAVPPPKRIYVPLGVSPADAARLRSEGWTTVAGVDRAADAAAEAKRLGCAHVFVEGRARAIA
ncbi:MAG: ATP phosphoribosyltransferase regulatory subunit [Gemmatimonas sp.]